MLHLPLFTNKSFYHKILKIFLSLSLIPLLIVFLYTFFQVRLYLDNTVTQTSRELTNNVLVLQTQNLTNQIQLFEDGLTGITTLVAILQAHAEALYGEAPRFVEPANQSTLLANLRQEPEGYWWEPFNSKEKSSNVGVSALTTLDESLYLHLIKTVHLDTLLQQIVINNPNLVAAYYTIEESAWRIYPALDIPKEVAAGNFQPDLIVQNYPFYYPATASYNPDRSIVWTSPYQDVTHRGWMISALAPVYDQDTLKGVVGVDYTISRLIEGILDIPFQQAGAYAFLVDSMGEIAAIPEQGQANFNRLTRHEQFTILHAMTNNREGQIRMRVGGEEIYLLYAPVDILNWSMGFIIPTKEISMPVQAIAEAQIEQQTKATYLRFSTLGFLTILAVLIFALSLAQTVVVPLHRLIDAAKAIGGGNLEIQVSEEGEEELKVLGQTFNQMTIKLKDLLADLDLKAKQQQSLNSQLVEANQTLEDKVRERTAALVKINSDLAKTYRRLERMEQSRRHLLAGISHELRTPMTLIQGYVEALQSGLAKTPEEFRNYLQIIQDKISGLDRIINDLFQLSQLESGQLSMNMEQVSAGIALSSAADKLDLLVKQAGLTLIREWPAQLPKILLDRVRLDQVITNLVQNSIKHTPARGTITISAKAEDNNMLTIAVKDSGRGIKPDIIPHIFTRFYKGDYPGDSTAKGSGLGLSICREIISAHHGKIWAESVVGQGTTVYITLPTLQETSGE